MRSPAKKEERRGQVPEGYFSSSCPQVGQGEESCRGRKTGRGRSPSDHGSAEAETIPVALEVPSDIQELAVPAAPTVAVQVIKKPVLFATEASVVE